MWLLKLLNTHPNRISYSKKLKNVCFAMDDRVCVAIEPTQYPDEPYIPLQNAKNNGVVQWNIVFVCLLSRLNTHTNRIFHHKTLQNSVLKWVIVFVLLLNQPQFPLKSYIPLQNAKKFGVLQWNIVFVLLLSLLNTHKN